MNLDDYGRSYLHLVLQIDKHIDGFIDAYVGPEDVKAETTAGEKKEPAALLNDLAWLVDHIPTGDPARRAYLTAVLRAHQCTLQLLRGDPISYLEEVQRLYDVNPQPAPEAQFTAAHNEPDALLPGAGPLADRIQARRQTNTAFTTRLQDYGTRSLIWTSPPPNS